MRLRYDDAEAAGPGGDGSWYRDSDNAAGLLSWGTSYAMMSYLVMFRATGETHYLQRLVWIADGVLAQRDSERGVADWRGESNPCWQATSYGDDVPYCWAVHSGMIAYPMAELAVVLRDHPELAEIPSWDGVTLGAKADGYVEAARAAAAVHEPSWREDGPDRGYYIFPADASFTGRPGQPTPLNMMNAMGRLHAALAEATDDATSRDRVRRLANHLLRWTTTTAAGGYAWNYWPETYSAPGEDISHAAINVGFADRAARAGIVFGDAHLSRFATTLFDQVYVDTATTYDGVGGSGATNGSSYRAQLGRWLVLDGRDARLHAAVRDTLARFDTTTSGSLLLGFALLAATDVPIVPYRFYVVDWEDLGERRRATAYGANLLIRPPDPARRYLVRLRYRASRRTEVQQWDGAVYHTVARLAPTGPEGAVAHVPYDPALYFDYDDGVLFQLDDAFVAGDGVVVWEPEVRVPPTFESTPPESARVGLEYAYDPVVAGDAPFVWTGELPPGAVLDTRTGSLRWAPAAAGPLDLAITVTNDYGSATQRWSVAVGGDPGADGGTAADGGPDGTADAGSGDARSAGDAGAPSGVSPGGCACVAAPGAGRGPPPSGWAAVLAVLVLLRAGLRLRAP